MKDEWRKILDHEEYGRSLRALCKAAVDARMSIGGNWSDESLENEVIMLIEQHEYGKAAALLCVLCLRAEQAEPVEPTSG